MPKEITHWRIAEDVFAGLAQSSRLNTIINNYKNLYLLGAVLPDSLMYMKFGKDAAKILNRAREIHNAIDSYEFIKEYVAENDGMLPDAELAMLFGMITHFGADSSFHPFTYYFGGRSATRHYTLETYADLYFKEKKSPPHKWRFRNIIKSAEIEREKLADIILKIFFKGKNIEKKSIRSMLAQHGFFQAQYYKLETKLLFEGVNLLPGVDVGSYLALFYPYFKPKTGTFYNKEYEYKHPVTGEKLVATLDALKDKTVRAITSLLRSLYADDKFDQESLNALRTNANTGMAGKIESDMRYFSNEPDVFKIIF